MKSCPRCLNLSTDSAVACEQCGTVLDTSVIARAEGGLGARTPTVHEGAGDRPRPTPPPMSAAPFTDYRPTPPPPLPAAPASPTGSGRRGQTVYMPPTGMPQPGTSSASAIPRMQGRKAIGVLVTYSWKPEGQVFPVREGRNLIGRSEECEICVPDDPVLSQKNSHITFRQSFVVGDLVSMSGTDLNGEPVEEQFRQLGNYARIRTGSTHWIFVIVDPELAAR